MTTSNDYQRRRDERAKWQLQDMMEDEPTRRHFYQIYDQGFQAAIDLLKSKEAEEFDGRHPDYRPAENKDWADWLEKKRDES